MEIRIFFFWYLYVFSREDKGIKGDRNQKFIRAIQRNREKKSEDNNIPIEKRGNEIHGKEGGVDFSGR